MKPTAQTKPICLRVRNSEIERIKSAATKQGMTSPDLLRYIIGNYLDYFEQSSKE
ncbi:hypothetical protein [Dechloromonas sp. ZS-1]|uniref:hypothetical protein n=1 Tax=Dechloromonas sp. ZS-1 TaxID=3138067 RepID=UPI0031FCD9EF